MEKVFSSEVFKIVLVGSFATLVTFTICGTIIELNEPKQKVESISIAK